MSTSVDRDRVLIHVALKRDVYEKLVLYTMRKYGSPLRKIGVTVGEILEKFFSEQGES